jgi:Common central domain of tyrosinase/Polyphenol oxidase middle domain
MFLPIWRKQMNIDLTRRRFLQQSSVAGGALLFGDLLKKKTKTRSANTLFVRKDIDSLSPDEITSFRRGIEVMKSRPVSDPTSWIFQANIHGVPAGEKSHPLWAQCPHGTYFFLSWHRMYLYFFERILRQASGDPNFAVPYWDYGKGPAARKLPLVFRQPADSTNPLYVSQREPRINEGWQLSGTNYFDALRQPEFKSINSRGFSIAVEFMPHNNIHAQVGGFTGWMGRVTTAARDPIFWLHHSNIDRLWNLWVSQGEGRQNPTDDYEWGNRRFTFYDENRNPVELTGCQILRSQRQLGYRYENDAPEIIQVCQIIAQRARPAVAENILVRQLDREVELTDQQLTITIPLGDGPMARLREFAAANRQIVLTLEKLEADGPTSSYFELYLNLPANATNIDYRSIHYAGSLSFFGIEPDQHDHGDGHKRSFHITDVYKGLKERNLWSEEKISLTFIPRGLLSPAGEPVPAVVTGRPRFAQVSIIAE